MQSTSCETLGWMKHKLESRLKAGEEGDDRGWDGWMASPTQWRWVWVNSGSCPWTRRPGCCSPWGHRELDTTEQLNWTELKFSQQTRLSVRLWLPEGQGFLLTKSYGAKGEGQGISLVRNMTTPSLTNSPGCFPQQKVDFLEGTDTFIGLLGELLFTSLICYYALQAWYACQSTID